MNRLKENGTSAPNSMKINAINVYGGKKLGIPLLREQIEEMLGIKIDYYVKVDLSGFKSIVDTIGGVYFTVPDGGLQYSDPTQNLYINLQGGYQLLDGEHSEQLVRFRKGYATQDLQRMQVQRAFIQEFIKQLMKKDTLMSNIPGLAANFIQYVETDFSITDAAKYFDCIQNITGENIKSETLPGKACMIGNGSYYVYDEEATKPLVESLFYERAEDMIEVDSSEQTSEEQTDSQ
jgi:LCP family protein required for cell wall assembly